MNQTDSDRIDALRTSCAEAIRLLVDAIRYPTAAGSDMERCCELVNNAHAVARQLDPEDA